MNAQIENVAKSIEAIEATGIRSMVMKLSAIFKNASAVNTIKISGDPISEAWSFAKGVNEKLGDEQLTPKMLADAFRAKYSPASSAKITTVKTAATKTTYKASEQEAAIANNPNMTANAKIKALYAINTPTAEIARMVVGQKGVNLTYQRVNNVVRQLKKDAQIKAIDSHIESADMPQ